MGEINYKTNHQGTASTSDICKFINAKKIYDDKKENCMKDEASKSTIQMKFSSLFFVIIKID